MNISPVMNHPPRTLDLELLALDLSTCTPCVGTLANIQQAIALLQDLLKTMGMTISVRPIVIESESQARQLQFATSPTIRINGADIALETLERQCDSCTDLCGCEGINCRVWRYQGEEYTEAPVGMIVDAILGTIYNHQQPAIVLPNTYADVPNNLKQFFNSKAEQSSACCSVNEQATCCDADKKTECCGTQVATPATCGCQSLRTLNVESAKHGKRG
ncbi:DUF2703 domain-containing protein [Tumidithrix elongata RA019]|uniref:DUF2703 domain-containing protein n=1 Tax=Tumidithrix elongata BACA0141 TaxID=2716417 RepID=A0AAW9Q3V6_9CYAN|nr:DUF2703 domain-containing protein [Tumidithrix elongata RA019]